MKYPIYNKKAYFLLSLVDTLLDLFPKNISTPQPPKKILICNMGLLGDLILTSSLFHPLKKAYPDLEIGVLCTNLSKQVLFDEPVEWIHTVDHWKRNPISTYLKTRRQAFKEIKKVGYDTALDCNFHFPNMAPLLCQTRIPIRIGFESAGLSRFLTHSLSWNSKANVSAIDSFFSLLKFLPRGTFIKPLPNQSHHPRENFIIIHMGTSDPKKEWPVENWKKLAQKLSLDGHPLIFTGKGPRENKAIEYVIPHLQNVLNLCDQLTWPQFSALMKKASLLLGVDSSAGHLAAKHHTPAVLLYTAIHPNNIWKTHSDNHIILRKLPPCSPCFIGCKTMDCIRDITIEEVYKSVLQNFPYVRKN